MFSIVCSSHHVSTDLCHITVLWTLDSARILALVLQLYERNKLKLKYKKNLVREQTSLILGVTRVSLQRSARQDSAATWRIVLPAQRYASAGTAMAVSLSVCLCQSHVGVLSKGMDGLVWCLAWRLLSISHTLCYEEV